MMPSVSLSLAVCPTTIAPTPAIRPPQHTASLCTAPHYSRTGAARKEHKTSSRPKPISKESPWRAGPGRSLHRCRYRCRDHRRTSRGALTTNRRKPHSLPDVTVNPVIISSHGKWRQLCRRAAQPHAGAAMMMKDDDDAGGSMEPRSCSESESEPEAASTSPAAVDLEQCPAVVDLEQCPAMVDLEQCPAVVDLEQSPAVADLEQCPAVVRVRVEGSVFPVDRALLASSCEYFRALFQSGMRESRQEEIRLQDLSAHGFLVALSVLLGSRPLLSADEIVQVIECAAFLHVPSVTEHLINIIDSDNCLLMYHTAATYGLLDLFKSVALFIRDMHGDLKDDLMCLPQEMISYVESLIPSSYVVVGTHSPSTELLQDTCRTVCYLDEEDDDWKVVTTLPLDASTTMAGVAVLDNKLYVVGGVADVSKNVVDSGFCYDPESDSWSMFPSPTQLRYNASLLGHEGALYALGGEFQRKPMASVEVFRPTRRTWSPAAHLPRAATNVPCTKAMNRVFICLWRPKDATEIYEYVPKRDQWELVTTLVRPQSYGHFLASHRDNLYVMRNGPDDDFLRCMMDCYNLTTGQWSTIPGQYEALLTAAIRGDSAFTLNRRVTEEYAIGRDLRWTSRKLRKGFPRIGTMWTFLLRLPRKEREPLERGFPSGRQELGRHAAWTLDNQSTCIH
ncbi:hypothetical protein ACEWY4_026547 [Coilia grayii]|uniref:BTB domain-containing protein n=1 Tax=Coilia grayii TaxID=363190 RepID=A0ABD1IU12_9TELE